MPVSPSSIMFYFPSPLPSPFSLYSPPTPPPPFAFIQISNWAATWLVKQIDVKIRVRTLQHLLDIAAVPPFPPFLSNLLPKILILSFPSLPLSPFPSLSLLQELFELGDFLALFAFAENVQCRYFQIKKYNQGTSSLPSLLPSLLPSPPSLLPSSPPPLPFPPH